MTLSMDAVLAELGIPRWRARPGVDFPGAPECFVTTLSDTEALEIVALPLEAEPESSPVQVPAADIYLCADVGSAQEAALLEGIVSAARQLSAVVRVESLPLGAQPESTARQIRLDDLALPSLAAMLRDPSLKRPVWAALKQAVVSLS